MGLLTTYSKANRVVDSDTVVGYSKARISGSWSYASGTGSVTVTEAWEYRRFKSKSYRYVGMNFETAKACAAAAQTYYNRAVRYSRWNADGSTAGTFTHPSGGNVLMADVAIQHTAGCMYDVVINVNEDDCILELFGSASPSSKFTTEDTRKYDDGETAFVDE